MLSDYFEQPFPYGRHLQVYIHQCPLESSQYEFQCMLCSEQRKEEALYNAILANCRELDRRFLEELLRPNAQE